MNIAGKIEVFVYRAIASENLKERNFNAYDVSEMSLLEKREDILTLSKYISPKHSHSYPFERVSNTCGFSKDISSKRADFNYNEFVFEYSDNPFLFLYPSYYSATKTVLCRMKSSLLKLRDYQKPLKTNRGKGSNQKRKKLFTSKHHIDTLNIQQLTLFKQCVFA